METELLAEWESKHSVSRWKRNTKVKDEVKELPDWDYIKKQDDLPKCAPSQMDRVEDLDVIVERWKKGTITAPRARGMAKRRGYSLNFHHREDLPGDWITVEDIYLGDKWKIYY